MANPDGLRHLSGG